MTAIPTRRSASSLPLGIAGLGCAGLALAVPAGAHADDFTVTNLNADGAGSLREAVLDADATVEADRILFQSKLSGEIHLDAVLGVGGGDLEVVGPGARKLAINADDDSRVFDIAPLGSIDVAISGLTIRGGYASAGGAGIYTGTDVDLTLSRVTISDNHSLSSGGGVGIFGSSSSLTVDSSTISGNTAGGNGGGIYAQRADLAIRSSTISGNSADSQGGGVWAGDNASPYIGGALEVRNSTVTGNEAGDQGGGLYESNVPDSVVRGSIVAGNTAGIYPDLDDGPWATSFSLIGDTDGADITDGGGNLLNVDPNLKPLANNGGPTDTHAFKKSPAKNKGPSDAPDKDQRGAPRKGQPDIGAYEFTKCKGVVVNRVGTSGKDKLKGTKRKDGMLGLGGNDKLKGKKGKDGLCGGRGKDKLIGGPGKDKFNGGPGKDKEVQ